VEFIINKHRSPAGPKTVRINLAAPEEVEKIATITFETQAELREFISNQGAAGLRNGGDMLISKLKQVRRESSPVEGIVVPFVSATGPAGALSPFSS
jgi:hypothetical protein